MQLCIVAFSKGTQDDGISESIYRTSLEEETATFCSRGR